MLRPPLQHVHLKLCLADQPGVHASLELQCPCTNTDLHYVCHQALFTSHGTLHQLCCVGMGHADSCSCIAGPFLHQNAHHSPENDTAKSTSNVLAAGLHMQQDGSDPLGPDARLKLLLGVTPGHSHEAPVFQG